MSQTQSRVLLAASCPGFMLNRDKNPWPVPKGSRFMRINPNLNELTKKKKQELFCIYIFHNSSFSGMQRIIFKNTKIQVLATHLHN